jgi:hypothetical protein
MRRCILWSLIALSVCKAVPASATQHLCGEQVTLTVANPTGTQRQELVAIDTTLLGFSASKGVVVRDAFGIERTSQLTYDGQLLIDVHVRPNSKAVYTIEPGTPAAVLSSVGGRQYPERLDDIAFENDRIGFRLYGPALQRKGEKGYGHDVWVKRTTELVLPELYRNDPRLSFHLDYGKALDCYAVGPTLGCGTPCLLYDGKIQYPWCYETYKILDKGPLRFTVQVDFPPVPSVSKANKKTSTITEHRILSLDKGSNFCEATVWYTSTIPDCFPSGYDVAAAFAIRPSKPDGVVIGDGYVHYADPTIDPDRHQSEIYVALLFPEFSILHSQFSIEQREGHALGILNDYHGQRFHYFFGAAWSEFDVRSQQEWQCRIEAKMQAQRQPLQINIQK